MWRKLIEMLFGKKQEKKSEPLMLKEAPPNHVSLESMTKAELDALGQQHGLKLDRRKNKSSLIKKLNEHGIHHK